MLWYLHLASEAGVTVVGYEDHPTGTMTTDRTGAGQFTEVTLRPRLTISVDSDPAAAQAAHARAAEVCFIARSVNFPVHHEPTVVLGSSGESDGDPGENASPSA
ncbi:OsmC family protein [Luteococcus peritonei]|uniref:OsmC family protein n=1 Tax=Luteococcus peritonei TaxID=88874 RepID=A0ABW4RUF4_9ACTN